MTTRATATETAITEILLIIATAQAQLWACLTDALASGNQLEQARDWPWRSGSGGQDTIEAERFQRRKK